MLNCADGPQVLTKELLQPDLLLEAVVARHLSALAYVMLGQVGLPLQPVLAFAESACLEYKLAKATKRHVLKHAGAELARG
jgi:hypothetical protein